MSDDTFPDLDEAFADGPLDVREIEDDEWRGVEVFDGDEVVYVQKWDADADMETVMRRLLEQATFDLDALHHGLNRAMEQFTTDPDAEGDRLGTDDFRYDPEEEG